MEYTGAFGAVFAPQDLRDYRGVCTKPEYEFPEKYEITMRPVKNSGQVCSCVAHALASIVEAFNLAQGEGTQEMSVGYIYGNREAHPGFSHGMYTRAAIAEVVEYGDVPYVDFPFNEEVPEILDKWKAAYEEIKDKGLRYRFTKYYRLYNERDIKASLMQNGPVCIAMSWYNDIKIDESGIMHTTQNKKNKSGSHAMVVYGWNKDGWLVQNSWGTSWGKGGRCVIPFNIHVEEFWGVVDNYAYAGVSNDLQQLKIKKVALEDVLQEKESAMDTLKKELAAIKERRILSNTARQRIDELSAEIVELEQIINELKNSIKETEKRIVGLEQDLLEIETPHSTWWKPLVKILNFFINLFKKKK